MKWIGLWLAVAASLLTPTAAVAKGYASIARDIVPSGEFGTPPTAATLPQIEQQRYTNRPTGIQQVLSFFGHAPGDR